MALINYSPASEFRPANSSEGLADFSDLVFEETVLLHDAQGKLDISEALQATRRLENKYGAANVRMWAGALDRVQFFVTQEAKDAWHKAKAQEMAQLLLRQVGTDMSGET